MFFFVVAKSKKNIDMLYMRKTISYFLCVYVNLNINNDRTFY